MLNKLLKRKVETTTEDLKKLNLIYLKSSIKTKHKNLIMQ